MPTTDAAWLVIPHRHYLLLTGRLTSIGAFAQDWGISEVVAAPPSAGRQIGAGV